MLNVVVGSNLKGGADDRQRGGGGAAHELVRLTPQAFSHFTLQRSGGAEVCVDVQGVHDLYTVRDARLLYRRPPARQPPRPRGARFARVPSWC